MQTVTTKAMAKVAAVATGLAMATSMLSLAPYAHAAALTSAQVSSILSLLSSFGADSSTIANVQASLTGGTPSSTTTTTTTGTGATCSFSKDLTIGSTGMEVTCLQKALIAGGFSIPAGATGYFGSQSRTAVAAWQKSKNIAPAVGYFGAISRAAFNLGSGSTTTTTGTTTTTTTTTASGTGLLVSVSPTSPNGSVLVAGQGIGDLGDFVFTNPSASPINVTALSFKRIGVSNDSTMTNVYLYNAGTRITDSAGVSASAFSYSDPVALFTVPANGSYTVAVRSDIALATSGQQIGVQMVSATSNGTLGASVSFPISGGLQTISAATLATVSYNATVTPNAATSISPQNDYPVWQDTITVSQNPVKLSSMKFTNLGSIDSSAISNMRLYVDGVMVGTAQAMGANRSVTFDLSANPVLLSTQSHIVKVLANITGGASRTITLSVQRSSDGMFVDSQLNQPVTPLVGVATFSAVTTNVITINSVTGTTGTSVSVAPTSPNSNVAVGGSNIKWASFSMLASGENTKVSDLYVFASTSLASGAIDGVGGLQNGKVFLNGVQVGSTKNIGQLAAAQTDFAMGSSLILPAGQTVTVDIYADAKTTAGVNLVANDTVVVSLGTTTGNAQGMASLNSATIPSAAISGNSITVVASTLTVTKYTGYGNQTMIAGAQNTKIGAFTLSAGSTEGVTVNTINFSLSPTSSAFTSTITNLTLKDDATGAILGSVLTTPSTTSNSFSVSIDIPASATKVIDIYANILSGAQLGTVQAIITTSTTGTGDLTGSSASAASTALQTISVGSGTLSLTRGAGDPTSTNIIAGVGSVKVGQFNFAGANSAYTVQNLSILVPNNAATSVTSVTVSYKDVNGMVQTQSQPLQFTTVAATLAPYATATFTGLTMYVPANDSANLDVFVGTPTVASGATSGAAINVTLDAGATSGTFRALNGAGVASTIVNSGTNVASNGTFYVRRSIPTFAMVPVTATVPTTGNALYRFSVTADPAGAIEWTHLKFNLATSSTNASTMLTGLYLVDEAAPSVNLLDNTTTAAALYASTTQTAFTVDLTQNTGTGAKYQQVAAGTTHTYDLMGTVAGFTTGGTLTISLATDGAFVANGTANGLATATVGTIWSDRSAASHAITTADWTNGYLLNNFTSNATSYSK